MDVTEFENFKQLTDSLIQVRKALNEERNRLTAISRQAISPYRSQAGMVSANQIHVANIQMQTLALEAAQRRQTWLVDFLASSPTWERAEFIRIILRFILRCIGFDATVRLTESHRARDALDATLAEIKALGMQTREMQHDEIASIVDKNNADRASRLGKARLAIDELKTLTERSGKLDALIEAVKEKGVPIGRGVPFTSGYSSSIRRLKGAAVAGEMELAFNLLATLPVRVTPDAKERTRFRAVASGIADLWGGPKGIGLFGEAANTTVVGEVIRLVHQAHGDNEPPATMEDVKESLLTVGKLDRDIQAALYWIGSAAEFSLIEQIPGIVNEDDYNFGLVTEIRNASMTTGRELFLNLGYTLGFPFEIASWATSARQDEADTGADLCIIVYVTLEDGTTMVRGALLQGKRAVGLKAGVFRENDRLGRNHQLIALTSGKAVGYYTFYHHPANSIGVSVVPAEKVKSTILGAMPTGKPLWEYTSAECEVSTVRNATDFASFLAFTLMDPKHEFGSINDALASMGEKRPGFEKPAGKDTHRSLAGRLVLVSVGGSLPAVDLEILKDYGFKETRRHARLAPSTPWTV